MKRKLLRSNSFVRAARRVIKKNPQAAEDVQATLALLAEDAFLPQLKTHKLKGELMGSWACSAGYDLTCIIHKFCHRDSELTEKQTVSHRIIIKIS